MSVQAPTHMQRVDEFEQVLDLYRERAPKRVLEVGTHIGGTLYRWLHEAQAGARVVAVDRDDFVSELLPDWAPKGVETVFIRGDSQSEQTAERVRPYGPFDWVFIDAGHFYGEVRGDWLTYGPMCAEGGVVVFHDVLRDDAYPHIEVWRLWGALEREHETEVIGVDTGIVYL